MSKPSIYLCGPITGLSYEEARNGWRREFASYIDSRIDIYSPMRQEGHLAEIQTIEHKPYTGVLSSAKAIVAKDFLDVQRATLIVANFIGAKDKSTGSTCEIAWAYSFQKPVFVIMEPEGNPHDSFFLMEQVQFRCDTVRAAAQHANAILLPGV